MRKAMDYLDEDARWAFNDNIFSNMMVEICIRKKEPIKIGRKIVGRFGNKTVVCKIVPDKEMPYVTSESSVDEYGVVHSKGERKYMELITNPLAIINRTIPMALDEASITFILERVRQYMATLDNIEDIKQKSEALAQTLHKLSERIYKEAGAQAGSQAEPGATGGAQEPQDNVVDADYEVMDDDKK
jgi:hypothetical protein